jgi:hypothetical protein
MSTAVVIRGRLITALIANRSGADHEAQRLRTQGYPSVSISSVSER